MSWQIITQDGRPEDRADTAAVQAFLGDPSETFPDSVLAAILDGAHPIKAVREHRGLTQAALAGVCETSAIYLSQIERGQRRAGRELRHGLGKALRVAPELLERGEG